MFLKNLIFKTSNSSQWRNEKKLSFSFLISSSQIDLSNLFYRILKPNENEKKETLIETLAEILWKAGDKKSSCVALNSQAECFSLDKTGRSGSYYVPDGITEKV